MLKNRTFFFPFSNFQTEEFANQMRIIQLVI